MCCYNAGAVEKSYIYNPELFIAIVFSKNLND